MPTLSIIHGFIGAGKTAFAKNLSAQTGAVHLCPDDYCAEKFSKEQLHKDWPVCFAHAVDALWQEAEKRLQSGQSIIFDMGFWDRSSRDYAHTKAKQLGVEYEHYYVYAPDEVLIARIKQRQGITAQRNLENFFELKKQFQEPQKDEKVTAIKTTADGN